MRYRLYLTQDVLPFPRLPDGWPIVTTTLKYVECSWGYDGEVKAGSISADQLFLGLTGEAIYATEDPEGAIPDWWPVQEIDDTRSWVNTIRLWLGLSVPKRQVYKYRGPDMRVPINCYIAPRYVSRLEIVSSEED